MFKILHLTKSKDGAVVQNVGSVLTFLGIISSVPGIKETSEPVIVAVFFVVNGVTQTLPKSHVAQTSFIST